LSASKYLEIINSDDLNMKLL